MKRVILVLDSHSILARWRNHFSQLLHIHWVNDVRQRELQLVPEPRAFEVELDIEKRKNHKSPGTDQIPAELIKAGCKTIRCEIYKLSTSILNMEKLPEEWKESIIAPIYKRAIKQTVVIIVAYHFCQLRTKCFPTSRCQG
jgi:hypothetical protein